MNFKTSERILSLTTLFSRKRKKLKSVQLITKQKKLSTQWILSLTILFSKKAKQIENSSADY